MTDEEMPVYDRSAVARLLGVQPKTISQYLSESKGDGRYADNPFPEPNGHIGRGPYWRLERKEEILKWAESRPGQGAGGGRPRRDDSP